MNNDLLTAKINLETAQIPWHELQRFFASGNAIAVDASLDLTEVAGVIAQDNAGQLKTWMETNLVDVVKDKQAQLWHDTDTVVWAVVIKPWVLVQVRKVPDS
jgi:hypothetical protein